MLNQACESQHNIILLAEGTCHKDIYTLQCYVCLFNTNAYEVAARVSPGGRYIFFDRPFKKEQDIHWIKATIIEQLKKKQAP